MRATVLLLLLFWAQVASGHKPSDSYLTLAVAVDAIEGRWDIALRDLDYAIGLDSDGNGEITWGEVRARHDEIASYALARLSIASKGQSCALRANDHLIDHHSDGAYAVLRLLIACPARGADLDIGYGLFFDLDPQHKGLLNLSAGETTRSAIFSAEERDKRVELARPGRLEQLLDYGREGVWHIWIGFDHVLFLLSLLLPAVLVRAHDAWVPATNFKTAFWDVFRIVTAFTVAHSITLSLATLGVVTLPTRAVESVIALSVVLAAANNLWPLVRAQRWTVAFAFGLIHGFGFASVLADLGLPQGALLLALVGFNVGVELGQLAIVALFLPAAYWIRETALYRRVVFVGGSSAIVLLAGVWFVERAFNLKLLEL